MVLLFGFGSFFTSMYGSLIFFKGDLLLISGVLSLCSALSSCALTPHTAPALSLVSQRDLLTLEGRETLLGSLPLSIDTLTGLLFPFF